MVCRCFGEPTFASTSGWAITRLTVWVFSALMITMKQIWAEIRLRELMSLEDGWGIEEGREVYHKFLGRIEAHPQAVMFRISLAGVRRTDVSFPRESVVELARRFRGQKGFSLWDATDENVLDNWDAAATKREQPLFVWNRKGYRLLGPLPSPGLRRLLDFALESESVTTAQVARHFRWSASNASNKLRALAEGGYLLRREETAASGGIEFLHHRIR